MGIHLTHLANSIGRSRQWLKQLHDIAGTYIPDYLADRVELSAGDPQGRQLKGLSHYQAAVLGKLIEDILGHSPVDGPLLKHNKLPSVEGISIEPSRYSKEALKDLYTGDDEQCNTSHNSLNNLRLPLLKSNPSSRIHQSNN